MYNVKITAHYSGVSIPMLDTPFNINANESVSFTMANSGGTEYTLVYSD